MTSPGIENGHAPTGLKAPSEFNCSLAAGNVSCGGTELSPLDRSGTRKSTIHSLAVRVYLLSAGFERALFTLPFDFEIDSFGCWERDDCVNPASFSTSRLDRSVVSNRSLELAGCIASFSRTRCPFVAVNRFYE